MKPSESTNTTKRELVLLGNAIGLTTKLLNEVTCDALRIRTTLQGECYVACFSLPSGVCLESVFSVGLY